MNDASGESMEPMEEVPLIKLGESENGDISAWLTDRSRELISETRRSSWCLMSLFLILLLFFSRMHALSRTIMDRENNMLTHKKKVHGTKSCKVVNYCCTLRLWRYVHVLTKP